MAFIGFGEAGRAFASAMQRGARAYDRATDDPTTRQGKLADYRCAGVEASLANGDAVREAELVLSLVTADQALAAASETAGSIAGRALYCDMNSVSPATKRAAAERIEQVGARYVDVAVMSPVDPAGLSAPLLVAGPHREAAIEMLRASGFTRVSAGGPAIGDASAVKMIRSVMVKGIEALTAECLLAAEKAGVREAVIASLDASWPGADWGRRGDYNLERMIVHGVRRADEMDQVVATLATLGAGSSMSAAAAETQRAVGAASLACPAGLEAKLGALLAALSPHVDRDAA